MLSRLLEPLNLGLKSTQGLWLAVLLSYIPSWYIYSKSSGNKFGSAQSFFMLFAAFAGTVYYYSLRSGYQHEIVIELAAYGAMILSGMDAELVLMLMFQTAFLHRVYTHVMHVL